eukprot:CAMPEP_0206457972 /NCGR_PEP_ID=MMETSP0324_2-20121206/23283_1 /ASSEMBLY_ACC=CAM_ASM_000836 /TAXON_ID=2866 /ORGANISM="Crypthecodinium cohnii, Strain Seligo" /LENGTH=416 /DNA_ID=CAMNT_0053929203 /DNA_START=227 /DNA_END=1474 /DNA_ORIENTATION=+
MASWPLASASTQAAQSSELASTSPSSSGSASNAKRQRREPTATSDGPFRGWGSGVDDGEETRAGSDSDGCNSRNSSNVINNNNNNIQLEDVKRSPELQADRAAILKLIEQHQHNNNQSSGGAAAVLRCASSELRADKALVLEAVKRDGAALRYASYELRGDEEVVLEAVQQHGGAIHHASARVLIASKDPALLACRRIQDSSDWWCLLENEQVGVDSEMIAASEATAIAARGEHAPVLTLTLSRGLTKENAPGNADLQKSLKSKRNLFHCEALLLSGASFACEVYDIEEEGQVDDNSHQQQHQHQHEFGNNHQDQEQHRDQSYQDESGWTRSGPTLLELAQKLVEELPKHSEVKNVTSVFLNFLTTSNNSSYNSCNSITNNKCNDNNDSEDDYQGVEDDENDIDDGYAVAVSPWDW